MSMPVAVIRPYLFFGGRAEEAIEFYRAALKAELAGMMRYCDCPDPTPDGVLPPGFHDKVMHAELRVAGASLLLSDGAGEPGGFHGFRVSAALPNADAAQAAFFALAEEGTVQMPIGPTFWSPCFGMVTDKFGLGWMMSVNIPLPAAT